MLARMGNVGCQGSLGTLLESWLAQIFPPGSQLEFLLKSNLQMPGMPSKVLGGS